MTTPLALSMAPTFTTTTTTTHAAECNDDDDDYEETTPRALSRHVNSAPYAEDPMAVAVAGEKGAVTREGTTTPPVDASVSRTETFIAAEQEGNEEEDSSSSSSKPILQASPSSVRETSSTGEPSSHDQYRKEEKSVRWNETHNAVSETSVTSDPSCGSAIPCADGDIIHADCATTKEPDPSSGSRKTTVSERLHADLFGNDYSHREGVFVLLAGIVMAFNCGFVNGSCASGLLLNGRSDLRVTVVGYTAAYTTSALETAQGDWSDVSFPSGLILSYMTGAFLAGLATPRARSYRIEPTYGPTFLVGGVFLLVASVLAETRYGDPRHVYCCIAASAGIQNGMASIYSANLIRCGLTGATTDFALAMGQLVRGNSKNLPKAIVIGLLLLNFWFGGVVSWYATRRFQSRTLFINAALFWLIGMALVVFLVREVGVSVKAAIFGTWKWDKVLQQLHQGMGGGMELTEAALCDLFDEIDDDGNGEIEPDELLTALLKADIVMSPKMVRMLIQCADEDGDGVIDRAEWEQLVRKMSASLTTKKSP